MFNFRSSSPTTKEQQRESERQQRKAGRALERNRNQLERDEKKLELEIKKLAKEGNTEACKVLAKELIKLRKQKNRVSIASSEVKGVAVHNTSLGANVKMADAMGVVAKSMSTMNRTMNPGQVIATMNAFNRESQRMNAKNEKIDEALDEMIDSDDDDEEESDQLVAQVLDEIGIEIGSQMARAPVPGKDDVADSSKKVTDEDIEQMLAQLKE